MESATQSVSKASLWAGRIISTLVVLFLLFDAVAKLMRIAPVLAAFTQLGFSTSVAVPIGAVLLVCTILYVIPPTSILGAILAVQLLLTCAPVNHSTSRSFLACSSGEDFTCAKSGCTPASRCEVPTRPRKRNECICASVEFPEQGRPGRKSGTQILNL